MQGQNTEEMDPFERLAKTHRRLEERLSQLEQAARDLAEGIGPSAALADVREVSEFLGRGARRHVEDEEQTLFPRLSPLPEAQALLEHLRTEHVDHGALEARLAALVSGWGERPPSSAEAASLLPLAQALRAIYVDHIAREEGELFPLAKRVLSRGVIEEMGREMMGRRPDRGKDKKGR